MAEGSDGSGDVPTSSKAAQECKIISSFCASNFQQLFSSRALDWGSLFAMAAFVEEMKVEMKQDNTVQIEARCYGSSKKDVRWRVGIMPSAGFQFADSLCQCTAGVKNINVHMLLKFFYLSLRTVTMSVSCNRRLMKIQVWTN